LFTPLSPPTFCAAMARCITFQTATGGREKVSATPVAVLRMGPERYPKSCHSPSAQRPLWRRGRPASALNPTFRIQNWLLFVTGRRQNDTGAERMHFDFCMWSRHYR
jgi:hypothetical protein